MVQHQVVSVIAACQQRRPRVVFKGGTLLRLCYRNDYRYSEDLDFDWVYDDDAKPTIQDFFDEVAKKTASRYKTVVATRWGAHNLNLEWQLPNDQTGVIAVDVKSRDFQGAGPSTAEWSIVGRHRGVDVSIPILGYSPESMLAAKLSCVADHNRLAARDYYDLLHLLQDDAIDKSVAFGEFTRRHTVASTDQKAKPDWLDTLLGNAYLNLDELTDRWDTLTRTGMTTMPHRDFGTVLETIHDALHQHLRHHNLE